MINSQRFPIFRVTLKITVDYMDCLYCEKKIAGKVHYSEEYLISIYCLFKMLSNNSWKLDNGQKCSLSTKF